MTKARRRVAVDALTEAQAAAEVGALSAEIVGHDLAYYQDDAPTISDADYDALRRRLAAVHFSCIVRTKPLG